jgi:GNAT superfamily N-acetyltransferase
MTTNTTIRAAGAHDETVIVAFNIALAAESEQRTLDREIVTDGVRAVLRDPARGRYFLAEHDAQTVGQLMLTQEWSDWRNGTFWWIQSVYVAPDWRGHGIFRALFAHVDALSRRSREVCGLRLYVERDNERAQAIYRHCGLELTEYRIMEVDRARQSNDGR